MSESTRPILLPYEPNELKEIIAEIISSEFKRLEKYLTKPAASNEVFGFTQKPLFKPQEVCEMLQISRQTLHKWVKDKVIKSYKIKSRVFFLWEDINKLLSSKDSDSNSNGLVN